jgi:hypothetical protein
MQIGFKRGSLVRGRTPLVCVPLLEGEALRGGALGELDAAAGGMLAALDRSGDFSGKYGSSVLLYNPAATGPRRILVLGAGKAELLDLERVRQTASRAVKRAAELGVGEIDLQFPARSALPIGDLAQALTEGSRLGDYRYDQYLTARDGNSRSVQSVTLVAPQDLDRSSVETGIERGTILGDVVCKVRDMVNAPANELTPTEMANRASASAKRYGYQAEILERRDIKRLGYGRAERGRTRQRPTAAIHHSRVRRRRQEICAAVRRRRQRSHLRRRRHLHQTGPEDGRDEGRHGRRRFGDRSRRSRGAAAPAGARRRPRAGHRESVGRQRLSSLGTSCG